LPERSRITKRADGRFVATIRLNGTRKYLYGDSVAEVRRKLDALDQQITTVGAIPTPGRRTVDALLDAWLDASRANLKPKTLLGYEQTAQWYIRPFIGGIKLSRLEPMQIQGLYASLAAKGLRRIPAQAHAVLHRACRMGVLWTWLSANPCDRVLPPKYRASRKRMWSVDESAAFLAAIAEHRFGPFYTFLAMTGARIGEALAVRWEDLDGDVVTIRRTVQRIRGQWVETEPKTEAGQRAVAMPAHLVAAVHTERVRQAERRLKAGTAWSDRDLIFSSIRGGYIGKDQVAALLKEKCVKLGLKPLTPHGLRHLSASLLLSQNVPLPNVSQRLGHAGPSITARIYSHVVRADHEAADALQRILAPHGATSVTRAAGR
jgi:integrase